MHTVSVCVCVCVLTVTCMYYKNITDVSNENQPDAAQMTFIDLVACLVIIKLVSGHVTNKLVGRCVCVGACVCVCVTRIQPYHVVI